MSTVDTQPKREAAVTVKVRLKDYLDILKGLEAQKLTSERREVPSIAELAEAAGVSRATLYNLAGGAVESVNLKVLSAVISELRERGFDTDVPDLLTALPADKAA